MVMGLKNVIFLLCLLKMCFIFGQETEVQKRIIIDVGHGGKDPGAIGVNGIKEKDVVLAIGKEMVLLKRTILGEEFGIYLTRYDDSFFSLSERTFLARTLGGDIFISLHCNSSLNEARGTEIFTYSRISEANKSYIKTSIALGNEILKEINWKLNYKNRGMKFDDFQVLRQMIRYCPAILIEVGFLTNPDEGIHISKPSGIRAIALAILSGIINYLKLEL